MRRSSSPRMALWTKAQGRKTERKSIWVVDMLRQMWSSPHVPDEGEGPWREEAHGASCGKDRHGRPEEDHDSSRLHAESGCWKVDGSERKDGPSRDHTNDCSQHDVGGIPEEDREVWTTGQRGHGTVCQVHEQLVAVSYYPTEEEVQQHMARAQQLMNYNQELAQGNQNLAYQNRTLAQENHGLTEHDEMLRRQLKQAEELVAKEKMRLDAMSARPKSASSPARRVVKDSKKKGKERGTAARIQK